MKKAVEMEITMTNDLSEIGKKFYEQKLFKEASVIYEIAVTNVNSKNYLLDKDKLETCDVHNPKIQKNTSKVDSDPTNFNKKKDIVYIKDRSII